MDSLSQFTLGAAVGEVVLGKKIGNKAILWGGLAGSIPDMDVFLMPFIKDPVVSMGFHRGHSHSFFFLTILSVFMAWLFNKWYANDDRGTNYKDWFLLFFLAFITHTILDSFTTWGTQLYLPFNDARVAFNNIFVVDPLYTIPFFLLLMACLVLRKTSNTRRWLNYTGLTISTLYICFTFFNKHRISNVVEATLDNQNIEYSRYSTAPTPFNNILWDIVVESEKGYHMGVYSFFDEDKDIEFEFFERSEELLGDMAESHTVDRIKWFANGYYSVLKKDTSTIIYDLKFGKMDLMNLGGRKEGRFIFPFHVYKDEEGVVRMWQDERQPDPGEMSEALSLLFERMKGNKPFIGYKRQIGKKESTSK